MRLASSLVPLVSLFTVSRAYAAPTYFTDRATFEAAAPDRMTEDFEDSLAAGTIVLCEGSLDSTTNNTCVAPGAIATGLSITIDGGRGGNHIALAGPGSGVGGVASNLFATNYVAATGFTLAFAPAALAVGLDLAVYHAGGDLTVELLDGADAVVASSVVTGVPNTGKFFGFTSDVAISKVRVVGTTTTFEGADNIAWSTVPHVASVTPSSGGYGGGTSVTIKGSGFESGATVKFDASAATSVVVVNATTITCTTPAHAAGAVEVTVVSGGNELKRPSGFTYVSVATTTTVTAPTAPASPVAGEPIDFEVTVAPAAGTVTGDVELKVGTTVVGTGTLDAAGKATIKASLPAGNVDVLAAYTGDGLNGASESSPLAVVVAKAETTSSGSLTEAKSDGTATLEAEVAANAPSTGTPTGTVDVLEASQKVGTASLAAGKATISLTGLSAGKHTVTLAYAGDDDYEPSTSAPIEITITAAAVDAGPTTEPEPKPVPPAADAGEDDLAAGPSTDAGCGCKTTPSTMSGDFALLGAAFLGLAFVRRRRDRR